MSGGSLLTPEEQIKHLESKGISFNLYSKKAAIDFLTDHTYLTKLSAYRKNYPKYSGGVHEGKYIGLDFAYLVELSVIDMHLRYLIMLLSLDIEHALKVVLINDITANPDEDGYNIVDKFLAYNPDFMDKTERKMDRSYCREFFLNNKNHLPVWVLFEVLSLGDLIKLYKLYFTIYPRTQTFDARLLDNVRNLRNAAAHSNCLIHDINRKGNINKVLLTKAVTYFPWMSSSYRKKHLRTQFTQDFTVLLLAHKILIKSEGMHKKAKNNLRKLFFRRMLRHREYFENNPSLTGSYLYCVELLKRFFN